jgi:hypothetical protein
MLEQALLSVLPLLALMRLMRLLLWTPSSDPLLRAPSLNPSLLFSLPLGLLL